MEISSIIGEMPYRLALAGGWIDQPFASYHNPTPPGSMVVVSLSPTSRFMERSGLASSTRKVAMRLWGSRLPQGDPRTLMRTLYEAENNGKAEPSGSQDMAGLIYPGITRLDYDCGCEGGYFPAYVENNTDPETARWLEDHLYLLPVNQRPDGYNPLGIKNLDQEWIRRLGQSGKDCFDAILTRDIGRLGDSMNECMRCWEAILPGTVRHPTLTLDLMALWCAYQERYPGAMYSGCGGGYLIVAAETPVPGALKINIRMG